MDDLLGGFSTEPQGQLSADSHNNVVTQEEALDVSMPIIGNTQDTIQTTQQQSANQPAVPKQPLKTVSFSETPQIATISADPGTRMHLYQMYCLKYIVYTSCMVKNILGTDATDY